MKWKYIVLTITLAGFALFITTTPTSYNKSFNSVKNLLASVFFVNSTTTKELTDDFIFAKTNKEKIKILIIPGHDEGVGGTQFRGIKESDLNIEIAESLTNLLRQEKEFNVQLSRNKIENHNGIQKYISDHHKEIKKFSNEHKNTMRALVQRGLIHSKKSIEHIKAPAGTVLRLYGINKWANENDIDMVLHLHFNDYPRRTQRKAGKYSGVSIYIPEKQFSNSEASHDIAKKVMARLTKYSAQSNMPLESAGIIEDQELIAIGAFNTLDPAVLLIEYGYIYESQFIDKNVRKMAIKELSTQTYLGILDFFDETNKNVTGDYDSAILPYSWNKNLSKSKDSHEDIFALQTALLHESLYPPLGKNKNDCPINGRFGPCTQNAVISFQKKYKVEPATGFVGPLTRDKLNELFFVE